MKLTRNKLIGGGASIIGGSLLLGNVNVPRLNGEVIRYHDAPTEVIGKIKEEGLKASYASDPENLTNRVLQDVPLREKRGLVYTDKTRDGAFLAGHKRAKVQGKYDGKDSEYSKDLRNRVSPYHKVLDLRLDYDKDIKNTPRVPNPELRGTKTPSELSQKLGISQKQAQDWFKSLGEDVHIVRGDIKPSRIVGGKGYKERGLRDVWDYARNNPARFGKEAGKGVLGTGLLSYGILKVAR